MCGSVVIGVMDGGKLDRRQPQHLLEQITFILVGLSLLNRH